MSRNRYNPYSDSHGLLMATLAGLLLGSRRPRLTATPKQLTERQRIAEINDWNREVEARRAAKKTKKGK